MNRKQKDMLIQTCFRQGICDAQTIFRKSDGWGEWTVARIREEIDKLQRRDSIARSSAPPVVSQSGNVIKDINNTSMDDLRFKDFVSLKVGGRDRFSALTGQRLESEVTQETLIDIQNAFPHDRKSQHSAIRWVLRGLEVKRAIRKVKTDLEVAANANHAREERDFWESEGAEDFALDVMKNDEELDDYIHPKPETETVVAGYTLIRSAPNLATIVTSDGEVLGEKEINDDKHWENFVRKFGESEDYRRKYTEGK